MKPVQLKVIALLIVGLVLAMTVAAAGLAVPNRFELGLLDFLIPVASAACIGGLIVYYRPLNLTGWFIVAFAFLFALAEFSRQYALFGVLTRPGALPWARAMAVNAYWGWYPGIICITVLLPLHFPTGRLLSPRWRMVAWLGVLVAAAHAIFATTLVGDGETPGILNPLGNPAIQAAILASPYLMVISILWVSITLLSAASLVLRYRRASQAERRQIKWFAFALVGLAIFTLLDIMVNIPLPTWLFTIFLQGVWVVLAISILWYHLFDIDLIIRRTLVYSVLTGILALVYFGGVTLLQNLFSTVSGQQSPAAIVLSTLIIAALFTPLRRRIQDFIDRRFYRRKYDAEKALAEFAAAARSEADLATLSARLTETVQETLQPDGVSLWLVKDPKGFRNL